MPEITLKLDDPAQTVELLHNAARHAGGTGWDHKSAQHTDWLARQITAAIEEQVKPVIEEPEAFGSLIRARSPQEHDQVANDLWQLSPAHGNHYWISQSGVLEVWSELTDVEVLRVGLGEPNGEDKAFADGYEQGRKEMNTAVHSKLVEDVLPLAIANERRIGVEKAIQAVEELAP